MKSNMHEDGTMCLPPIGVPLSTYMSAPAKAAFLREVRDPLDLTLLGKMSVVEFREYFNSRLDEKLRMARAVFQVDVSESTIGGVQITEVKPKGGVPSSSQNRVLVNLHGGGFFVGAGHQALLESIPIAASAGVRVIAINYRQGPEFTCPAASADVATVYRDLLNEYLPGNVGLYGGSAGGILVAMTIAWLEREQFALPGAIGILSAGAFADHCGPAHAIGSWGGDSRFTAPVLCGGEALVADAARGEARPSEMIAYLGDSDLGDPLLSPALFPALLARFPPTLLITGTRSYDMSAAVQTHRLLTKVGVKSDLHVWDGMWHGFFDNVDLPESQEVYTVMVRFFDTHLGR
jgi:monoterpene epsilon-lactone hydrolase